MAATSTWSVIIKPTRLEEFMTNELTEWIQCNLQQQSYFPREAEDWDLLYGSVIWNLWTRRNRQIFDPDYCEVESLVQRSRRLQNEATHALAISNAWREQQTKKEDRSKSWCPPPQGWYKLNTDGAQRPDSELATCGGLIRDAQGEWIVGFAKPIRACSVLDAELWGVFEGMTLAWNQGVRDVIIETDNKEVLNLLKQGEAMKGLSSMTTDIAELIKRQWRVSCNFVPREEKRIADELAKMAWDCPLSSTYHSNHLAR
ncbi:hypothetical protein F3Y22_tig00110295pilonHSYRG00009 [Hibiscus syriacus]|uniref:RNase H type-1 domain-containing protein n=1 Tax=Hibiscus syriacus TaxID=106335 RepID=A0A6A3B2Z8_HIBSY|nr:hypothetical protein F3Y22_tig00110295pilonHSYRG00009 [Hibiscus syriacus]